MDKLHQIKSPSQPFPLYYRSLTWLGCLVLPFVFQCGPDPMANETGAPALPIHSGYSPVQTVLGKSVNATGENKPIVPSTLYDAIPLQQGILREITGNEKGKLRGSYALIADDDSDDDDDDDDNDDDSGNDSPTDSSLVERTENVLPALPPTVVAQVRLF